MLFNFLFMGTLWLILCVKNPHTAFVGTIFWLVLDKITNKPPTTIIVDYAFCAVAALIILIKNE